MPLDLCLDLVVVYRKNKKHFFYTCDACFSRVPQTQGPALSEHTILYKLQTTPKDPREKRQEKNERPCSPSRVTVIETIKSGRVSSLKHYLIYSSPPPVHTGDTCILGRQPSQEYQTELTSKYPLWLLIEFLSDVRSFLP